MAAYSAVVCFRLTLRQLLDSGEFHLPSQKTQIKSLYEKANSLKSSFDKIIYVPKGRRDEMKKVQTKIREAIYIAQDKVEYYSLKGLSSQIPDEISLMEMVDDIDLVAKEAESMAEKITNDPKAWNLFPQDPDVPKKFSSKGRDTIVGQEKDFAVISDMLIKLEDLQRLVIPVTGPPGLGKTTLARSLYENTDVKSNFDIRGWVTVSQDFNFKEICSNLLSSMESKNYDIGHYATQGDEQTLFNRLHQELYNRKFLIVVDDVWDIRAWEKLSLALPDKENGSRVILTSRIKAVVESIQREGYIHQMEPLGLEDSWELLCYKVFDEVEGEKDSTKACPAELKETGRSIAKKCKGLPLLLTVVAGLLVKGMEVENWKRIEEDVDSAASEGEESYMDILSLSYTYLPARLKALFLYLGAFPEDSKIRVSKLIKLWAAEGFSTLSPTDPLLELKVEEFLDDLVGRNLISVLEKSSRGGIKLCSVHDSLRELAERESRKEKFFHSRKKFNQRLEEEDIEKQRRVSVHVNLLMSLEEVYDRTKSISSARTLLYLGPHHHHPLPFCLTFDLLRVLDAFSVYFVYFPDEFLQLFHLTYLSLTFNHELPPQISQLQRLQTLMVRREPKLIFVGASFLPDEIWKMRQLRHLWFTESDFPALPPYPQLFLLLNLQTLTNVNAALFTDEVLDNMPNLRKLAMWIEAPDKLNFSVAKLHQLEHFRFVVLNPVPGKGIEVEAEHFFPKTLKRLHLSGCGLPWEYMQYVAENLRNLEVLKLKELAFHGGEWSPDYEFINLKYLLIEYLNFQKWEAVSWNYPCLEKLILRHCYELEEIPRDLGYIGTLEVMELVDCSPDAVKSANAIIEEQDENQNDYLHVRISSSWE